MSEQEQSQLLSRAINQLEQEIHDDQEIKAISLLYERKRANHKFSTSRNHANEGGSVISHNKSVDMSGPYQTRNLQLNKSIERMGYSTTYQIEQAADKFSSTKY